MPTHSADNAYYTYLIGIVLQYPTHEANSKISGENEIHTPI